MQVMVLLRNTSSPAGGVEHPCLLVTALLTHQSGILGPAKPGSAEHAPVKMWATLKICLQLCPRHSSHMESASYDDDPSENCQGSHQKCTTLHSQMVFPKPRKPARLLMHD